MAQFAMVAIIAIGLNVVVGQAGLLDLGYVGFYAVGAYTVALLTSPDSPWNQMSPNGFLSTPWAWLSCVPLAMAVTALTGLILGFPTLRLRGDYLAIVTLGFGEIIRLLADNLADITNGPRGLNEVAFPHLLESEQHPEGRVLRVELQRRRQLRHLVVLAGPGADRHHPAARRQPRTQPGRPRVGRRPGGRGRRRSHGRQHVPLQAVGVHHRRGDRRTVRRALRRAGAVRRAADVQHHQLDAVPVRGGARRPGQQARRDPRRVHHRVSAQPPARACTSSASTWAT